MRLVPPLAHFDAIDLADANRALVAWGHRMGAISRPNGDIWAHGLFEQGRLVGVTVTASLIRETCAGLTRAQALELARLCAARPGVCRVALRLWREVGFPVLAAAGGQRWAVSYQDAAMHTGNVYRFDGWREIGRSRSGTDPRSGRQGRNKIIWGWELA